MFHTTFAQTASFDCLSGQHKGLNSENQRTNGPVNAHLISWPSKAHNMHYLENIW